MLRGDFCELFFWFSKVSSCTSLARVTNIWYVPYIFDQRSQLCRDLKIKKDEGREKKPFSAHGKAGLICVDKLQATKVVITGVYTPISNSDKQWSPRLAFEVCLQPIPARRFHPQVQPQPFGISNILWSFTKPICPSPLRAPDHTAAWATGFICDHRQFVTVLSLSLRGFLQNILIIPYKISILMILLWTEIRSCGGCGYFHRI